MGTVDTLTFGQMDKIEYFFNLPWNERLAVILMVCIVFGIAGALTHFILTKFKKDSL